jgi:hypothetical protein
MLKDAINLIRGAVMICYPQGLPKWDLVQQAIVGTFSCMVFIFLFSPCGCCVLNSSLSLQFPL